MTDPAPPTAAAPVLMLSDPVLVLAAAPVEISTLPLASESAELIERPPLVPVAEAPVVSCTDPPAPEPEVSPPEIDTRALGPAPRPARIVMFPAAPVLDSPVLSTNDPVLLVLLAPVWTVTSPVPLDLASAPEYDPPSADPMVKLPLDSGAFGLME